MTIFEMIKDIATTCPSLSDAEENTILDAELSDETLEMLTNYITGCYASEPLRLEDHTSGETIGTWDSLVAFIKSKPSADLLNKTIHDVFYRSDDYAGFDGTTWTI